ncbi:SH3 domain-containing protein [Stutzerimonas urumqiensis]|uniref:SH3 domain-containing protein n=1 Tax=Stutzerimonas urumqiensis TaxID=638269 RepID=UPI000EABAF44|nr:SH3 domain-containing protein [Stutzerimonas urumqiensis]
MGLTKKTGAFLLTTSIAFSAGCANTANPEWATKENIGTVLGTAAGVLIGSQIGGGSGRTAAMIAGALAGGYLGKAFGAQLDERDRQALAEQTQRALQNAEDGQSTQWSSTHSDAKATITPIKTETVTRQVAVKRAPSVQPVANMTLINQPYRTLKSANVRSAPDLNAEKVGGLPTGTTFTAIGLTDNDWIMVGRRGVTIGYVYAPLVAKIEQQTTQQTAAADTATDLDSLDAASASSQGIDLDAIDLDAAPVEQTVAAQATCRTISYDVTTQGSSEQQTAKACQAADGAWELI